ncbi:MAG: phosphoribosylamine--glycine ligase [Saprospiraceae bacterium]|nr:phosphoribosylamine--glycine ligase [Saprospiraceae bacterium]
MNILLLGSGGREHAIAWKLSQSKNLPQLFIAPGNAGTSDHGTNIPIDINDFASVSHAVRQHHIELVIIGPEAPLVNGLADRLALDFPSLPVVGPRASGAQLEGSKSFSKDFMARHQIPTAKYHEFTKTTMDEGIGFLQQQQLPIVLKADGLAAGKGVLICQSHEEAISEFREMLSGKFGEAGSTVVIEEFLDGIEFSVFVLTDGMDYKILPVAKDYKRIGEGDTGLNTGGMGSISPVPFVTPALMQRVESEIIQPTIRGIQEDDLEYCGFIFFGLINVAGNPMVIEYNCRLGDPETQSVLARLNNDLIELCLSACSGTLSKQMISISEKTVATIVVVAGGYPGPYEKGKVIKGLDAFDEGIIFHAGTRKAGDQTVTNGGRVLAVTSFGETVEEAVDKSRDRAGAVTFEGAYFRKDIGFDLV